MLEKLANIFRVPDLRKRVLFTFGLLAVFTAAISINLLRGIDISCGCFTLDPDAGPIGWWEVVRDIGFLALAGFVLWADLRPRESAAK